MAKTVKEYLADLPDWQRTTAESSSKWLARQCPAAELRPLITEANRLNHELGDPTKTKA